MPSDRYINILIPADEFDKIQKRNKTEEPEAEPKKWDIQEPRWEHWYQRKLARVWMATLLSMNIEPTVSARRALALHDKERYAEYLARVDIAKALAGHDLPIYEDHLREGDSAGNKYVSLADYYHFANALNWSGLEQMYEKLHIATKPPEVEDSSNRKLNGIYVLLHEVLLAAVDGFDVNDPKESGKLVEAWLKERGARQPVQRRSIETWMKEMALAVDRFNERTNRD